MENKVTGVVSAIIDSTVPKVWEALTTPEIIKQYFFDTNAISDWKVGSPLIFRGIWQGKEYEDKGTILKIVPEEIFQYSYWSSMSGIEDKPENYVTVTYELKPVNIKTLLTITQENIPGEKMKEHSEENWRKVIDNLKKLIETPQMFLS